MCEPDDAMDKVHEATFGKRRSEPTKWITPNEKLRESAIFEGCSHDFVSKVIVNVDCKIYSKGETIIQEGDKADSCYILLSGLVDVLSKGVKVAQLSSGAIFGEMCLLGIAEYRTASVVAADACDVRVVGKREFNLACKSFPNERQRFLKEAERRVADTIKKNPAAAPPPKARARRIPPVLLKLQSKGMDLGLEEKVERAALDNASPRPGSRRSSFGGTPSPCPSSLGGSPSPRRSLLGGRDSSKSPSSPFAPADPPSSSPFCLRPLSSPNSSQYPCPSPSPPPPASSELPNLVPLSSRRRASGSKGSNENNLIVSEQQSPKCTQPAKNSSVFSSKEGLSPRRHSASGVPLDTNRLELPVPSLAGTGSQHQSRRRHTKDVIVPPVIVAPNGICEDVAPKGSNENNLLVSEQQSSKRAKSPKNSLVFSSQEELPPRRKELPPRRYSASGVPLDTNRLELPVSPLAGTGSQHQIRRRHTKDVIVAPTTFDDGAPIDSRLYPPALSRLLNSSFKEEEYKVKVNSPQEPHHSLTGGYAME